MDKTNFEDTLDKITRYLKTKNLDYFDIRLENTKSNRISLENKIVKEININDITGIGIRIINKGHLGFCSSNNINNYKQIIDDCIKASRKTSKKIKFENWESNNKTVKDKYKDFEEMDLEKKVKELKN